MRDLMREMAAEKKRRAVLLYFEKRHHRRWMRALISICFFSVVFFRSLHHYDVVYICSDNHDFHVASYRGALWVKWSWGLDYAGRSGFSIEATKRPDDASIVGWFRFVSMSFSYHPPEGLAYVALPFWTLALASPFVLYLILPAALKFFERKTRDIHL
jgi:hypothetical protein